MNDEKKTKKVIIAAIIAILIVIMAGAAAIIFVLQMDFGGGDGDHMALAEEYLADEEYEDAISEYLQVLDEDATNVDAYLGIVDAYVALEDYDAAIDILEEGLLYLEDEGDEDDIDILNDRLEEVNEAKENGGETGGGETPGGEDGPGEDGPDEPDPPVSPPEPSVDRIQILTDFYNTEKSSNSVIEKNWVFDEACGYMPAKGERPAYAMVGSGIEGYVADTFYDFDMDGEDELVLVYYYRSDEFGIEVYDVENENAVKIFTLNQIEGGICGIDEERFNDTADVEIGICQKNGKIYITETAKYTSSVFSKYFRNEMYIYEVNGSGAERVFFDYVSGKDQNDMLSNPYMMEAYRGFPEKLKAVGFNSTAQALDYDLNFSPAENITPIAFGCSRHCGTYESFNAKKGSSNPGRKSFVFSDNATDGRRSMDSAH